MYHWRDTSITGWLTKAPSGNSSPGLQSHLAELQDEYLCWPDSVEEWKRVEEFNTRWNVPHAVGAIDGKHIAMKKPKKTGSDY